MSWFEELAAKVYAWRARKLSEEAEEYTLEGLVPEKDVPRPEGDVDPRLDPAHPAHPAQLTPPKPRQRKPRSPKGKAK